LIGIGVEEDEGAAEEVGLENVMSNKEDAHDESPNCILIGVIVGVVVKD